MTYTCTGSVRGSCGHQHRSAPAALRCLKADRRACRAQGGYSDRIIVSDGETLVTEIGDDGELVIAEPDEPEPDSPITTARELAGLTQSDLAARLGVDRAAVHQAEARGEGASLALLRRYVEACGCELVLTVRESRARLGVGAGRPRPVLGALSAEAKAARAPLPPEELVEAQHDRVHRDPGRARAARTVRNSRRGTT